MSIKPVGYVHLVPDEFSQDYDVRFWSPTAIGTKLYHIPDTHRVVSVELLKFAAKCMRNDNNQAESFLYSIGHTKVPSYLLKERALTEELQAIIEDKP